MQTCGTLAIPVRFFRQDLGTCPLRGPLSPLDFDIAAFDPDLPSLGADDALQGVFDEAWAFSNQIPSPSPKNIEPSFEQQGLAVRHDNDSLSWSNTDAHTESVRLNCSRESDLALRHCDHQVRTQRSNLFV